MKIESLIVQGIPAKNNENGAIVPPIYLASTYVQPSIEEHQTYAYGRGGNPTRNALEELISKIEGVDYGFAFASGMAATTTAFNLFKSGDKILVNSNVYGGTYRYLDTVFQQQELRYELVDDFNLLSEEDIDTTVKALFIETPSNPLLQVTDIQRLAAIAHQKGILIIVDNTFATPYLQKPFELGADIVLYSATKYLSGHADVIAGLLTVADSGLAARIKHLQNTLGNILSPFDSYSLIRGIKTLSVRMDRQEANTVKILAFLKEHEAIARLNYPGSASPEEAAIQKRQTRGNGSVFSIELTEEYNPLKFVEELDLFDLAVSLGGVESLVCHPSTMTHESYAIELQEKIGISAGLFRFAIGIEHVDDLINDLAQALDLAKK